MNRKKIPYGTKLPVKLTLRERDLIRDETFCTPDFAKFAVVDSKGIKVDMSLDDIEENAEEVTEKDLELIKLATYQVLLRSKGGYMGLFKGG
jgi:hypothetical protein